MSLHFAASTILPLVLIVIMFGLGLALTVEDFKRVVSFPKAVVIGLVCQIAILPLVAFGICHAMNLSAPFAIGLMLLAASPGGPTSNLYSKLSGGDLALNLTLTAVNSAISPFTLPLVTGLAIHAFSGEGQQIAFQTSKIIEVFLLVIVPVSLGMGFNIRWPKRAVAIEKPIRLFSVGMLVVIIIATALKEWPTLSQNFAQAGWAVLAFNLLSLSLGYFIPRFFGITTKQAIAIAFEIGIHNGSLALFVAISILNSTAIAVPAAIYSILMYFTAAALSYVFVSSKTAA